jgi:hypothetical protein
MFLYSTYMCVYGELLLLPTGAYVKKHVSLHIQLLATSSVTEGKFDKCLHFLSIFISWRLTIGLIIRYVSLNIIEIIIIIITIISKSNIFTETRNQYSFQICDLSSCNLLAETNNFVLCPVLLSCLVSELQKLSSPRLELRTVSSGLWPLSCNLLNETNNFVLGDVSTYRIHPHRVSNQDTFSDF